MTTLRVPSVAEGPLSVAAESVIGGGNVRLLNIRRAALSAGVVTGMLLWVGAGPASAAGNSSGNGVAVSASNSQGNGNPSANNDNNGNPSNNDNGKSGSSNGNAAVATSAPASSGGSNS